MTGRPDKFSPPSHTRVSVHILINPVRLRLRRRVISDFRGVDWGVVVVMSGGGKLGIPVLLLHEAEGQVVTIELQTSAVYRGYLDDVEDNWNLHLTNITRTERDGES